jgi:hypothetical protein
MKAIATRISVKTLATAVNKVRGMTFQQKEHLGDEIHRMQPDLLGSVIVMHRLGVSYAKIEFLLEIVWICYQAMKESGLVWPKITVDDFDRQATIYIATVKFGENLSEPLQLQLMQQFIDGHPEQYLLAFVQDALAQWMARIIPEESDKHIMLAAITVVNCIAYIPLPGQSKTTGKKRKPR